MVDLLNATPYFIYSNYSVPIHDPVPESDLKDQLRQQIRPVEVVIVLAGMYVAYSHWIQFEIDFASLLSKPILGVKPLGNERITTEVTLASNEIVGWNTDSIISAIRRLTL